MIDTTSQTWWTVRDWANGELVHLTSFLEHPGLDLAATETIRGRIATLRALLALAHPKTVGLEDIAVSYS